jgi:hypothetical protein
VATRQALQGRGVEGADAVGVEVDHADRATLNHQRRGHLAAHARPGGDVPRLGGDIGDQERAAVQRHPAGDTLPGAQGKLADFRRQALLDADLKVAAVGAQQGQRAAVRGKCRHDHLEDPALGRRGVRGARREGRDAIQDRHLGSRIGDLGLRR